MVAALAVICLRFSEPLDDQLGSFTRRHAVISVLVFSPLGIAIEIPLPIPFGIMAGTPVPHK